MFIGHFAVAFGMKRVAPEVKLGTAVAAVTLLDLIWPVLVAEGVVVLLLVTYLGAYFGPPPPNVSVIVIADIVGTALTVVWAYWVDRRRSPAT